jgi:anti-sigma factor RsiW
VARHVASLGDPRHQIEVTSSDRHTVKPWFHGKLDFAPTVADLSSEGYVLLGGRLEKLGQRPTAALVYQVREHPISLFMEHAELAEPVAIKTIRGFSVATWASGGVRFAVVADTDVREMERFARLVQATR